jgi:hypothetical protein
MLQLKTERQVKLIVNNIVAACYDIDKLNSTGYNYIYLASGFIAHTSIYGFQDYYRGPHSLAKAIIRNQRDNQWSNFRPREVDYGYYRQKGEIYNEIVRKLEEMKHPATFVQGRLF